VNILAAKANERHEMIWLAKQTDPLLGREWDILGCPLCGRREQVCWEPFKKITLEPGEDDLTEADVKRILELSKAGRLEEAKVLMASQPGHHYATGPLRITGMEVGES